MISTNVYSETSLYTVNARPHLNVRSEPNTGSRIIGKVVFGQAVRVRSIVSSRKRISGKTGRWVKIQYNIDSFGYVFDAFLRKPSRNSYSFKMYKRGNDAYRSGLYYRAINNYHKAFESANNQVDQIKILGALAQISKEKGNIGLAKGYAKRILRMDGRNEFSKKILALRSRSKTVNSTARSNYSASSTIRNYATSSRKTYSCSERAGICLALTWGPDACSAGFNKYAAKELDSTVNDIIASPTCLVAISEALHEDYSQTDIEYAVITGALDEIGQAGINSDNFFYQMFGGFSYIYSYSIKFSLYESCMKKCR